MGRLSPFQSGEPGEFPAIVHGGMGVIELGADVGEQWVDEYAGEVDGKGEGDGGGEKGLAGGLEGEGAGGPGEGGEGDEEHEEACTEPDAAAPEGVTAEQDDLAEGEDGDETGDGGLGAAEGREGDDEDDEGDEAVGDETVDGVGEDAEGMVEPTVEREQLVRFGVDVSEGPGVAVAGVVVDEMDGGRWEEAGDDGKQALDGGKGRGQVGASEDDGEGKGGDEDGGGSAGEEGESEEEAAEGEAGVGGLVGSDDAPGGEQGQGHGQVAAFAFGVGEEEGGEGEQQHAGGGQSGLESGPAPFDADQEEESPGEERNGEADAEFLPGFDGSDPGGRGEGATEEHRKDPQDGGEDSIMADGFAIDAHQGVEVAFDRDGSLDERAG